MKHISSERLILFLLFFSEYKQPGSRNEVVLHPFKKELYLYHSGIQIMGQASVAGFDVNFEKPLMSL